MKSAHTVRLSALVLTLGMAVPAAHAGTVYANNPPPGDTFTNATANNMGQAVGSSGWYYNNVRNGATVGINTARPRSGDGSVFFNSPDNGKADIEYLPNAAVVGAGNYESRGSLGLFSSLSAMSYEWLRDASSTAGDNLHPSLRIIIDRDGNLDSTGDRGGLVFERVYNGASVSEGAWTLDTITASTALWNFGFDGFLTDIDGDGNPHDSTLAEWQAYMRNAVVIGFSSGVGSGWGPFSGAVDNISWTLDGVTTTTNFEVQAAAVPEPGTMALLAFGLAGVALRRRRVG